MRLTPKLSTGSLYSIANGDLSPMPLPKSYKG